MVYLQVMRESALNVGPKLLVYNNLTSPRICMQAPRISRVVENCFFKGGVCREQRAEALAETHILQAGQVMLLCSLTLSKHSSHILERGEKERG